MSPLFRPIRTLRRLATAIGLVALVAVAAQAQTSLAPSIERAARGVAHVSVAFEAGGDTIRVQRSSSGIVVDPRGLVLTNDHLVSEIEVGAGEPGGEYWLIVSIGGGRTCTAKLVARDESRDLALLQLDLEEGELISALEFATAALPAPGTGVFAVAQPSGGHRFALAGTVARPSGPVEVGAGLLPAEEVLLSDAAVVRSYDGSPLLDRAGRVLGIVNTARVPSPADSPGPPEPPKPGEEPEPEEEPEPDYAFIVSAAAIWSAFPDELGAPDAAGPAELAEDEVVAAVVRDVSPAVVSVWTGAPDERPEHSAPTDPYAKSPQPGLGSGVVIDPSGLVLTSSAVLEGATEVSVRMLDGSSWPGDVVKALPYRDITFEAMLARGGPLDETPEPGIALVQLRLPEGTSVEAIELGGSGDALSGEVVAVVGNPYGHTPTVSAGVLAALEVDERLRVGAMVHAGQKGGALVDVTGRLLGIAVADIHDGVPDPRGESYLGVAVPIDRVREWFAAELQAHGSAPSLTAAPEVTAEELLRRSNIITGLVAATRDSLLNVEVKAEAKQAAGFDPFGSRGVFELLGQGSGAVIDESGLALTNWHVVDAALGPDGAQRADRQVEVTLPSGKRYTARVLSTSRDDDLALIQLEVPEGDSVKPVTLGHSKPMKRGDVTIAIGNPFGKANTVTTGIVAAKDQDTNIRGRLRTYEDMLRTDAAINPGNSGGALLDLQGHLIGINSAGSSGVGLAIPVERVRKVFGTKLLAAQQLRAAEFGMTVEDSERGVVVREVDPFGPAARAGIEVGDELRALGGAPMEQAVDVSLVVMGAQPMVALPIQLVRDDKELEIELIPVPYSAWRIFRQTGIELAEVDYSAESALVQDASVALYRSYTRLADAMPPSMMTGALRVVQVRPADGLELDLEPDDLLLGAMKTVRSFDSEHTELVRFESLAALRDQLEPIATNKGVELECWILRDGVVRTAPITVRRVR